MSKYPNINVDLIGEDGNAYSIIARVTKELRKNKISEDVINKFRQEATSGDYNHLLQVVMEWVDTDNSNYEDEDWDEYDLEDED